MRPFAPGLAIALTPALRRAAGALAAALGFPPARPAIDSRAAPRLRVAGGVHAFEARFGDAAFALIDISEEGFCIARGDAALPPRHVRAELRRNGEIRQVGLAEQVWTSANAVGYRFREVAALDPEPVFAGARSAARLRQRLRL